MQAAWLPRAAAVEEAAQSRMQSRLMLPQLPSRTHSTRGTSSCKKPGLTCRWMRPRHCETAAPAVGGPRAGLTGFRRAVPAEAGPGAASCTCSGLFADADVMQGVVMLRGAGAAALGSMPCNATPVLPLMPAVPPSMLKLLGLAPAAPGAGSHALLGAASVSLLVSALTVPPLEAAVLCVGPAPTPRSDPELLRLFAGCCQSLKTPTPAAAAPASVGVRATGTSTPPAQSMGSSRSSQGSVGCLGRACVVRRLFFTLNLINCIEVGARQRLGMSGGGGRHVMDVLRRPENGRRARSVGVPLHVPHGHSPLRPSSRVCWPLKLLVLILRDCLGPQCAIVEWQECRTRS